jgi:guanine deaminase
MSWQEGEQYLDPHTGYTDLRGKLLLPGFIDTHVHYPQTEMIGAFGEQLLEWLTTYTFPVESQFADEAYAKEIAEFFINQLVSHGTTTALVFCTLHPESVDALFTEALRLNMRLIAGKVMMDTRLTT